MCLNICKPKNINFPFGASGNLIVFSVPNGKLIFLGVLNRKSMVLGVSVLRLTVKTLSIGTPRPATVVVLNLNQFNFTMK